MAANNYVTYNAKIVVENSIQCFLTSKMRRKKCKTVPEVTMLKSITNQCNE